MEPFFLGVGGSPRFCIHWPPHPDMKVRGAVLYVHPFAEELNKSRRMAALQARRFSAAGLAVLQIDLLGCGDSAGDFEDVRVEAWEADLDAASSWLHVRYGIPLVVWGLRLGALLSLVWMGRTSYRERIARALLWQPVTSGARHLDQFLRIAVAADHTAGDRSSPLTLTALRQRLAAGETLEIGGYRLPARLAAALDALTLDALSAPGLPVDWIEISLRSDAVPGDDARRIANHWRRSGAVVDLTCVEGKPFWGTTEIVECEALLSVSTRALAEC